MITPLLALALIAPSDTPIEPIDRDTVETILTSAEGIDLCVQVNDQADLMGSLVLYLDVETVEWLSDMQDKWFQYAFEEGYSPAASMTLEAEEFFFDWLDDCSTL